MRGLENYVGTVEKTPTILALWHNRLSLATPILYRVAPQFSYLAVVSNSRDGKLLAKLTQAYRQANTIQVSHDKKHKALKEMVHALRQGDKVLVITPDGPRGPRYEVKPGVTLAAKHSGAQIVPMSWSCTRFWQLRTWDKFIIPKPFAKIVYLFDTPLHEGSALEDALQKLTENANLAITTDLKQWPR